MQDTGEQGETKGLQQGERVMYERNHGGKLGTRQAKRRDNPALPNAQAHVALRPDCGDPYAAPTATRV